MGDEDGKHKKIHKIYILWRFHWIVTGLPSFQESERRKRSFKEIIRASVDIATD